LNLWVTPVAPGHSWGRCTSRGWSPGQGIVAMRTTLRCVWQTTISKWQTEKLI